MDCALVRRKLADYLDGILPEDERRAFQAHLTTCAACRAKWALLQEVDEAMATWPVLAEPEGLANRVIETIRASESGANAPHVQPHLKVQMKPPMRLRWQDALLGLALALTVAVLVLSVRYTWAAGIVELRALDLQVQQSLSLLQRAWYAARAEVGRVRADIGRAFGWVSSGIVLLAAAVAAIVLVTQWPVEILTPFWHHRRSERIAKSAP